MQPPFQLLPELPTWEFNALKASILKHGVIIPIIKDENGTIIDGHHRERACRELKIKNVPTITLAGLSDGQKRDHALLLNLVRRKLTRKQLREIIAAELRRSPDLSNRWLAEIVGSTKSTVESVREDLLARGEISHVTHYRGRDGKRYSVSRIYSEKANQQNQIREAFSVLGEDAPRRSLSQKQLSRLVKAKERVERNRATTRSDVSSDSINVCHSDFRNLEHVAGISPSSVDLILTDVPYDKNFAAKNFDDLAEFCRRVLKPGGILAIYVGVIQVADAIHAFSRHLEYQATGFSTWKGDGPVIQSIQCVSQSTPVLVFSKGEWSRTTRWKNSYQHKSAEQDLHVWQKPVGDAEHWLLAFSDAGDLVCDPFCGAGTTAVACIKAGRKFVGGDIDENAVAITERRIQQELQQPIDTNQISLAPHREKDRPKLAISFSGGRSSAVMTKLLLEECHETHEIIIIFANTGCEHPDTLRFINDCDRHWNFNTVWIEAEISPEPGVGVRPKIVTYETCSRNGVPFRDYIAKYGIPNRNHPQCTGRLKTEPIQYYLKTQGFLRGKKLNYDTAIGIRVDETDRISSKAKEERFIYPLVRKKWTQEKVITYMSQFEWDLKIPEHLGNCTWCWKKSLRKHLTLAQDYPEVFDFPKRMEEEFSAFKAAKCKDQRRLFFRGHKTTDEIIALATSQNFKRIDDLTLNLQNDWNEDYDRSAECSESCEAFAEPRFEQVDQK